ncbi:MAG: trigger factor [Planctomycetota bacterium]|jgi:trigger factor
MTDEDMAVDQQETDVIDDENLSEDEQEMAKLKEAISVEKEEIGCLRLKVAVTVPRAHLDEQLNEQFDELRREANIPGFRRGHAPMKLVEKRFASDVGDQLKGQLVSKAFLAASEKEEFETLGDPVFWVNVPKKGDASKDGGSSEMLVPFEQALDHIEIPKEGDMTFTCEVEIKPEFELPQLDKIPLDKKAFSVSDEDVEGEVKRMLMFRGQYKPVEDGKIETDDILYADLKGTVDGEEFYYEPNFALTAKESRINQINFEGFAKAVKGKKAGDTVNVEATIPDDFDNKDLRGKTASLEVVIQEVKRLEIPEIDKEFLEIGGFENEKEFRSSIRSSLEFQIDQRATEDMYEQIGDFLCDNTDFDLPDGLSDRQVQRSLERRRMKLTQQGLAPAEVDKEIENIRDKAKDQVIKDLKLHFVLEKIAEEKEVEVKDEQFNAAVAQIAARSNKRFDRVRDELYQSGGLQHLYMQLRDTEVLKSLLESAEITEVTEVKDEKEEEKKGKKAKKAKKKAAKKKTTKKKEE